MKNCKFTVVCVAALASAALSAAEPAAAKPKMTAAERRAWHEARIAADGGILVAPAKGKIVRVICKTDKVSKAELEKDVANMSRIARLKVELVDTDAPSKAKTGCLITLAELDQAPALLVAPEDFWATINVTRLISDNPSPDVLKSRVTKELWRALGYALCAANPTKGTCVMRPITCLSDLDAEPVAVLTPQPLMGVANTAAKLGFSRNRIVSYRTACQEGWAPRPTNDVQKAIWDKVHALPTEPIRILPESQKK